MKKGQFFFDLKVINTSVSRHFVLIYGRADALSALDNTLIFTRLRSMKDAALRIQIRMITRHKTAKITHLIPS